MAQTKVASSSDTSTVPCWVCVLLGLFIPIISLGATIWAAWMAREDSRFVPPAVLGLGIVALRVLPLLG
jgi:hypothetical protein